MYHPASALATTSNPFEGLDHPIPHAKAAESAVVGRSPLIELPGAALRSDLASGQTVMLLAMIDEVDHGMLVLRGTRVLHANRAARQALEGKFDANHPLLLNGQALATRNADDGARLEEALVAARLRRLRKLLVLTHSGERLSLTIIPLPAPAHEEPSILIVLGKRRVGDDLAVFWYARSQGLTQAESTVLQDLCKGMAPQAIAAHHGVAISTIRTQLSSIRAKTGTSNLRDLVNEVACLPPLVNALVGATARH